MLREVITDPLTLLALAVVALGLLAWWQRERLQGLVKVLSGLAKAAENSFGFEAVNRGVVEVTQTAAEDLRGTQTGLLNWNVAGIVAGLVIVMIILVVGA